MRETLREELGPQPRLAKVQFVLTDEAGGVAVEQRQRMESRRPAARR